ncbi:Ribonuclease [Actinidia chinensis var. chinensis]|uniref:Ribonuclease n=1 Tax=Actinidia chinensis var. chinensis TaxID=1590841 RepID=A0A2R6PG43_ACTCC|nr:Ribonuclease [Actinidia chinensis var. chinensis]
MSRHRRQASQVLPPEIISGDKPLGTTNSNPQGDAGVSGDGTGSGTSVTTDKSTVKQDASLPPPPAAGKKPPAGRPTGS